MTPIDKKKNNFLMKLGKRVRELRKEQGYSQEKFAQHIAIDRTYMGMVERGERNITIYNVIRIAEGL